MSPAPLDRHRSPVTPRRVALLACAVLVSIASSSLSAQDRGERLFSERFDVGAGGLLEVEVGDADIEVRTGGSEVSVEVFVWSEDTEWGREVFNRMAFDASVRGSTVTVTARNPRIRSSEWRRGRGVGVTAVIHVPSRFDLDLDTDDGDIVVDDIEGDVRVRSSDGDIDMASVRGSTLEIESSDGDLTVSLIDVDRVSMRSSDGDIRVEGLSGEGDFRTSDGDVRLTLVRLAGAEIHTGDGDVVIYVPEQLDASITLQGEDVEVDLPMTLRGRISDERVEGTLGNGGPPLRVTSGDGGVVLRRSR